MESAVRDSCTNTAPTPRRARAHHHLSHLELVPGVHGVLIVVAPVHILQALPAPGSLTFDLGEPSAVGNVVPASTPEPCTHPTPATRTTCCCFSRRCRDESRASRAVSRAASRRRTRTCARRWARVHGCAYSPSRSSASRPPELRSCTRAVLGSRTTNHARARQSALTTTAPVPRETRHRATIRACGSLIKFGPEHA